MTGFNRDMTSTERVLWRQAVQAAHEAAREPSAIGKGKALTKALAGADGWRFPDLRPVPLSCFRAFVLVGRAWAKDGDMAGRTALAPRLEALADMAGDILDGIASDRDGPEPAWTQRADLQ